VALLAYTYGLNGLSSPPSKPWLVNLIERERVLADARHAKASGAELVIVRLQWGNEYQSRPTPEQQSLARTLLASADIDLVVGHHVHVVQPIEKIGDEFVLYGLGNFLSNQSPHCCPPASQDGVIVTARVDDRGGRLMVSNVSYTPTWVDRGGYVVRPVADALDDPATPAALRPALWASWARTVGAIGALGAGAVGVAPTRVPMGAPG
jgi:hypothetical protein